MTRDQLIKKLKKYPKDTEVVVALGGHDYPVVKVRLFTANKHDRVLGYKDCIILHGDRL